MKNNSKCPALPVCPDEASRAYPVLDARKIAELIESKCGSVAVAECHGKGRHSVFLLPEAFQEYKMIVSHGRRSPMNRNEKKFVGLGHFLDGGEGAVNIVVSHFIEIPTTNRSEVSASNIGPDGEANPGMKFLTYNREEFQRYEKRYNLDAWGAEVDPFLGLCGTSEYVLNCHTHPNLGVFFSGPDKINGAARAASTPVCNFVCDPIQGEMLGCVGKDFEDARIVVYDRIPLEAPQAEPQPGETRDSRTGGCIGELMRLANNALRVPGITGNVKSRTRLDGKVRVKIDLVLPKHRRKERA